MCFTTANMAVAHMALAVVLMIVGEFGKPSAHVDSRSDPFEEFA